MGETQRHRVRWRLSFKIRLRGRPPRHYFMRTHFKMCHPIILRMHLRVIICPQKRVWGGVQWRADSATVVATPSTSTQSLIYNRLAFLQITGNRLSHNLCAIESCSGKAYVNSFQEGGFYGRASCPRCENGCLLAVTLQSTQSAPTNCRLLQKIALQHKHNCWEQASSEKRFIKAKSLSGIPHSTLSAYMFRRDGQPS